MTSLQLMNNGLLTAALVCAPVLAAVTLAGLLVAVLQTLTQIQDQSLQFAVKAIVCFVVMFVTARWIGSEMVSLTLLSFETVRYPVR